MKDRIKNIMSVVFDIPADEINDESSPDTIESWDSLKHMSMVVALEEEFGVEFDDGQIGDILNFKLIVTILSEEIK